MNKELRKAVIAGNWKMNKNPEETKALLAEVAPLVKDAACEVGETDQTVNQRIRAALDAGLSVILCVGEMLEQREQGITEELVALQTKIALLGVTKEELTRVIIAYEPIWAIGTGRTATSAQAGEVCWRRAMWTAA